MPPLQNDLAAYQFDQAVLYVGLTIENALHEREEVGPPDKREWRQKYTLAQLLDASFRLPPPKPPKQRGNVFDNFVQELMSYAGQPGSGGRVWRYVGPEPEKAQ